MAGRNRKRKGRPVNGVLLLDKPSGVSSNHALQSVKRLFFAAKAGHTGSLDPLATGMLPICLGEATKISAFLLEADKRYSLTCQLGITTTTGDAEGEVLEKFDVSGITLADVEKACAQFVGEIQQVPPMYSALKHEGKRLYELARQGIEVERKSRTVTIIDLQVKAYEDGNLDLEVHCTKGTYVRTLVEDIGKVLGCGGYVTRLHRTSVGPYEGEMHTLESLEALHAEGGNSAVDALLLPIESGIASWPDVNLEANAAFYIGQGQAVQVPHAPTHGLVRLYDQQRFMGVGEIQDDGLVAPKRMIQANT